MKFQQENMKPMRNMRRAKKEVYLSSFQPFIFFIFPHVFLLGSPSLDNPGLEPH
jgi:hypothetical protein